MLARAGQSLSSVQFTFLQVTKVAAKLRNNAIPSSCLWFDAAACKHGADALRQIFTSS